MDESATLKKFADALSTYVEEINLDNEIITDKVNEFFNKDENRGKRVPCTYFESQLLQMLGVNGSNFALLSERVSAFVKSNKGEIGSDSLLHIAKGKNGGVARLSDATKK